MKINEFMLCLLVVSCGLVLSNLLNRYSDFDNAAYYSFDCPECQMPIPSDDYGTYHCPKCKNSYNPKRSVIDTLIYNIK